MASKDDYDNYAAELTARFEELTRWAIMNWPKKDFPLLRSDFSASSREIGEIVGSKLGEGSDGDDAPDRQRRAGQYVDMNPMPWP